MKNVVVWNGVWNPQDCQNHPNHLFVFDDNMNETGKSGLSVIRDEPNSFGIWTRLYHHEMASDAFFKHTYEAFRSLNWRISRLEHDIIWENVHRRTDTVVLNAGGSSTYNPTFWRFKRC